MATIEKPALRPANPRFSTGPTAKRPGWSPEILKNALVGRGHRSKPGEGASETRHRRDAAAARGAGRLPDRHRSRLRYRRHGDGALVAARRARRRCARLGELWARLGDRRREAAQASRRARAGSALWRTPRPLAGRLLARRDLHLERHDLRRARAGRRLDPGGPRRASRSATRPAPPSRSRFPSTSSMSSPSPGRRFWAARRSTACSSSRHARPSGSRPTSPPGRCQSSSA